MQEKKNDLKEFDEGREKHTCETCRKYGRCDASWKNNCRTGRNDDYTCSDYWKIHRTDEEWDEELWKEIDKNIKLSHKNWKAKKIIKEFIDILKAVKITVEQYDALSETLKRAEQFLEDK